MPKSISSDPILVIPWPADPFCKYHHCRSGQWGLLSFYSDGNFHFEIKRLKDITIINSCGARLLGNTIIAPKLKAVKKLVVKVSILRNTKNQYFIGAAINAVYASMESDRSWPLYDDALFALLSNKWKRRSKYSEVRYIS